MYGKLINSVTVGAGGATTIDFTSIPGTYTDLILVITGRTLSTGSILSAFDLRFNGDTGANYTLKVLQGTGSSALSNSGGVGVVNGNTATTNTHGSSIVYIPNYSGSTTKSYSTDSVIENNDAAGRNWLSAALWNNTAAITSISITAGATLDRYSTAYLYGLTKGIGGATAS